MFDISPVIAAYFSQPLWLAVLISVAFIPLLYRPAKNFGLVDTPKGRKKHKTLVPLVGGPAIFLSIAISFYVWGFPQEFIGVAISATALLILGILDDIKDISAKFRLLIQASLVTFALAWDGIWISQIELTNSFTLQLGYLQYLITIIAVLGVMNAINMLDGLDGLSSGVVLIILGFIIALSVSAGVESTSKVSICTFGAVFGFWVHNYRFKWREKAFVFLGDSGTTLIGFLLPIITIKLSLVAPLSVSKPVMLWLFAIPIWDICAVVLKRIRDKESPLQARRDHIHHVLLNSGLSVRKALHLIYFLTIASISFGMAIQYFALTNLEAYVAFGVFLLAYLNRVGSLSQRENAEIYDFLIHEEQGQSDDTVTIP